MPRTTMHGSIARRELVVVGGLGERRAELEPQLLGIFLESFLFEEHRTVAEKVFFRDPESKIELLWSADDRLLAFVSIGWDRFEFRGVKHSVMDMGMYTRAGLRGLGGLVNRRAVAELLRERLRHPGRRASYVGEMVSPVSYRQAVRGWPNVHPRRDAPVPSEAEELVVAVTARRGLQVVDDDPWRVKVGPPFRFRDLQRIEHHVREAKDPDLEFYVRRNPGYARGDWLIIWVPFDLANVAGACARLLR